MSGDKASRGSKEDNEPSRLTRLIAPAIRLVHDPRGQRALLLVPLAAIGIAVVWRPTTTTSTQWTVTIAVVLLVATLVAFPDVLRHLGFKSIKLFGVFEGEVNLGEESSDVPTTRPSSGSSFDRWMKARFSLEAKLAYVVKHTLPDNLPVVFPGDNEADKGTYRPYANIGSLRADKLLRDEDAQLATSLLTLGEADLRIVDPDELKKRLDAADALTLNFRLRVFRELLARHLKDNLYDIKGRKRRIWSVSKDGVRAEVAPIYASSGHDLVTNRVGQLVENAKTDIPAIVVIPKRAGGDVDLDDDRTPSGAKRSVHVVTLDRLLRAFPS